MKASISSWGIHHVNDDEDMSGFVCWEDDGRTIEWLGSISVLTREEIVGPYCGVCTHHVQNCGCYAGFSR